MFEIMSATELLNKISALNTENPWHKAPNKWIFRGQGQDYPLCPKILREGILNNYYYPEFPSNWEPNPSKEQNFKEIYILATFFETMDKQGVATPVDCADVRKKVKEFKEGIGKNVYEGLVERAVGSHPVRLVEYQWPPQDVNDPWYFLLALAQHYGVATRFLDWTRRPYIAAYFAASDAVTRQTGNMVVWAANVEALEKSNKVKVITLSGVENRNLTAQLGIMTTSTHGNEIQQIKDGLENINEIKDDLIKITLPVSQAGVLLKLLSLENIDGATMFPGIEGVTRKVHEVSKWDEPFEGNVKTW